jgi:hypothetical protein
MVLLGASIVLARTAENDVRIRAAQGRRALNWYWSPGLILLYPWWARVIAVATAVVASEVVAGPTSNYWLLCFLAFMVIGVLVEWFVVYFRRRRW